MRYLQGRAQSKPDDLLATVRTPRYSTSSVPSQEASDRRRHRPKGRPQDEREKSKEVDCL